VLLYDLWKVLRGEEKEEVPLEDAKVCLMAILRITAHKRIGVEEKEQEEEEKQKEIGFFNDKNWFCLRVGDVPRI